MLQHLVIDMDRRLQQLSPIGSGDGVEVFIHFLDVGEGEVGKLHYLPVSVEEVQHLSVLCLGAFLDGPLLDALLKETEEGILIIRSVDVVKQLQFKLDAAPVECVNVEIDFFDAFIDTHVDVVGVDVVIRTAITKLIG